MVVENEQLRGGRYAVTGILGEGSQGQTLEAVDKRGGRLVAIKRFRIRGAVSWKDVELAEREARVLSGLKHPGLPEYIEHFEENGALYLVMEKIPGRTLRQLSESDGLDQSKVVRLLNDMAAVLDYLHLRSPPIIHRDIKPTNIIERADGSFALVDFGSVRDRLKPDGGSTVVGTFGYMAPEQFQGRALPATDVYGLAVTALTVLTGSDPDQLPHRGLALDVERALTGQVDVRLVRVLQAMLAPDPDVRARRVSTLLIQHGLSLRQGATGFQSRAAAGRGMRPEADTEFWDQHRTEAWFFKHAFVVPLLLLGLEVGKLATWMLFGVLLPTLLTLLSIFWGGSLRRTARHLKQLDRHARRVMTRASTSLAERADSAAAYRHQRRQARKLRVQGDRRRVAVDSRAREPEQTFSEPAVRERTRRR